MKDKGKFTKVIEHYEKKKRKTVEAITKEQKELAAQCKFAVAFSESTALTLHQPHTYRSCVSNKSASPT